MLNIKTIPAKYYRAMLIMTALIVVLLFLFAYVLQNCGF